VAGPVSVDGFIGSFSSRAISALLLIAEVHILPTVITTYGQMFKVGF